MGVGAAPVGVDRYHGTPLASRAFVRDIAIFAEHIVMNDVHEGFFSFDGSAIPASRGSGSSEPLETAAARSVSRGLRCREAAPWWAPDKVGELSQLPESQASRCGVRLRRAAWAVGFANRWSPEVLDWIDTGVGTEKAVSVLRLWVSNEAEPILAVAFRGSKGAQDYYKTDANPFLVPLPAPTGGGGNGDARTHAGSDGGGEQNGPSPKGYVTGAAGDKGGEVGGSGGGSSDKRGGAGGDGGKADEGGGGGGGSGGGDATPARARSASGGSSNGADPSTPARPSRANANAVPTPSYPTPNPATPPPARTYPPTAWVDVSSARFMPLLTHDPRPCVTLGAWRAYAGDVPARCDDGASPRQRVRRALETALREFPRSRIVITGHSLGGGLAALCAYDLLW
jgi:hypothetical protein